MYCSHCGQYNNDGEYKCTTCGMPLNNGSYSNEALIRCPACGSVQIEFVTYQASGNFSASDACCGYLLCGPLGLLCGAKPKTEARTVRKCKNCGKEF